MTTTDFNCTNDLMNPDCFGKNSSPFSKWPQHSFQQSLDAPTVSLVQVGGSTRELSVSPDSLSCRRNDASDGKSRLSFP